ncbi:hypothetical protein NHP190002_05540 [Helicobacter ailurogastricus]|nr:hypothetical protein NHP190002_05540 [Helicobacter ailurogastricus]
MSNKLTRTNRSTPVNLKKQQTQAMAQHLRTMLNTTQELIEQFSKQLQTLERPSADEHYPLAMATHLFNVIDKAVERFQNPKGQLEVLEEFLEDFESFITSQQRRAK